jgi:microcystin-dependent protein
MSQPFIGQIIMFGGNFAPSGWAFCNGQLLSIAQNDVLFTLIGTTYGGDGQNTFALPDLRGRVPINQGLLQGGGNYVIGQVSGTETVTLIATQLPMHTHLASCNSGNGSSANPAGNFWAATPAFLQYVNGAANTNLNVVAVASSGSNQLHDNVIPYLTVNYVIALVGIFPSRN